MARNLAFIDRILADKDALSAKCGQLSKEVASAQVRMLYKSGVVSMSGIHVLVARTDSV